MSPTDRLFLESLKRALLTMVGKIEERLREEQPIDGRTATKQPP